MVPFLCYHGLRFLGVPALARRTRPAGLILGYHNVLAPQSPRCGDPGIHLGLDTFAAQVTWLTRHYRIVPLVEMVTRLDAGRSLRGLAAITFDDAYSGALEYGWPLLRDLGLPATAFIVAQSVAESEFWWDHPDVAATEVAARERWLTTYRGEGSAILATLATPTPPLPATHRMARWETLAAAANAGLALGAHSLTHRNLPLLTDAELQHEIRDCRQAIHARTGLRPELFAYPYGRWDTRVRDRVRHAGYRGAVTLDYGLVTRSADPWALPRVNVPATITRAAFVAWTTGLALRRRSVRNAPDVAPLLRLPEA